MVALPCIARVSHISSSCHLKLSSKLEVYLWQRLSGRSYSKPGSGSWVRASILPHLIFCFGIYLGTQIIICKAGQIISLIVSEKVNDSFSGIKVLGRRLSWDRRRLYVFCSQACAFHHLADVQTCCQFFIKHLRGKWESRHLGKKSAMWEEILSEASAPRKREPGEGCADWQVMENHWTTRDLSCIDMR